LQEVTPDYFPYLEESEFFNSGFQRSEADSSLLKEHFPVIVSRIPFTTLYNHNKQVIALFSNKGVNFIVVNVHLTSVEALNLVREREIGDIFTNLDELSNEIPNADTLSRFQDAINQNNVIIGGDFNMHFPVENKVFFDHNMYDLWLDEYSHEKGDTWVPEENRMLRYKSLFDNRSLRLDRMAMLMSKEINVDGIEVVGKGSIDDSDVYMSDHFGIATQFCKSEDGFQLANLENIAKLYSLDPHETGGRSESDISKIAIIVAVLFLIFLISLCLLTISG